MVLGRGDWPARRELNRKALFTRSKTGPLFYEPHQTSGASRSLSRAISVYTREDRFSMSRTELRAQAAVYREKPEFKAFVAN